MRGIDALVLIILLIALAFGGYILWQNLPTEVQEFKGAGFEGKSANVFSNGTQFYPNMRYMDKEITFTISQRCDSNKREDVLESFSTLSESTILKFKESSAGEILILCTEIAPEPQDRDHFVAGEGGPKDIYLSGPYYVIKSGRISLFRDDKCEQPKIALHEILHALGFDHNNNPESIMYPVTNCKESLDDYIIDEINKIYSVPSAPDIMVSDATAEKAGKYLTFDVEVTNAGLRNAGDINLSLYNQNEKIKEFSLGALPLGNKKEIKATNVIVPKETNMIRFVAYLTDNGEEISLDNNEVNLKIV